MRIKPPPERRIRAPGFHACRKLRAFFEEAAVANRRFKKCEYRQLLVRLPQGDTDREIHRCSAVHFRFRR